MEKTSFKRRDLSLGSLDINHKEQRNRCWGRMSRTFKGGVRIEKCDLEGEELRYRKCHGQRILFRTLNKHIFFFCFFSFWSIDQRQTSTFQLFFTPTTAKNRNPAWVLTSGSNQVVRSWQCLLLLLSASKSRMVSWHCRHESVQVQFLLCWGGGGVGSVGVEGGGRVVCGVPGTLVRPVNPAVVFGCGFKRPEDANL